MRLKRFILIVLLGLISVAQGSEVDKIFERIQQDQKRKAAERAEQAEAEKEFETRFIRDPSEIFGVSKKLFTAKEQREIRELAMEQIQLRKQVYHPAARLEIFNQGSTLESLKRAEERIAEIAQELDNYRIRGLIRDEGAQKDLRQRRESKDELGFSGSYHPRGIDVKDGGDSVRLIDN